jgi:DnaJ domain
MQLLLFGMLALTLGLLFMRGFARANPTVLARQMRQAGGIAAIGGAVVLLARGMTSLAMPLFMLGSWLLTGARGFNWRRWLPGPGGAGSPGRATSVRTDHLEMELDHDTGALRGRVIKGVFRGRAIETLAPAELALLWQDCRFNDPPSAQVLETYLDRVHATWREDMARAEATPGAGGIMTREEAFEILGLKPGASAEQVRAAHRDLMLRMHPDRGGSTYLAAKINQAKDVLLKR